MLQLPLEQVMIEIDPGPEYVVVWQEHRAMSNDAGKKVNGRFTITNMKEEPLNPNST